MYKRQGVQRAELPVYVALGYGVGVYEHEAAYAGAREGLGAPRAHSAEADHGHPRRPQTADCLAAEQHFRSFRPLTHTFTRFLQ